MVEFNGNVIYREPSYSQYLWLKLTRSGNTVHYEVSMQCSGSMYANVQWNINNGWRTGTTYVSMSSAGWASIVTGSWVQAAATSFSITATMFWGGVASVSGSIGAAAPTPGVPSGFSWVRNSDAQFTVSFTKGSNATSTQLTASKNGAAWYDLANPTGTSQTINGLTLNTRWRFNAYSKGAGGNSAVVSLGTFYTKPSTPSKPTLASGKQVNWNNTANYVHGVEIQRTDNGGSTVTTTSLDVVNTWTDTNAQNPLTQYRVRTWAGPSNDQSKTYSNWSSWSDSAMVLTYNAPDVVTFKAVRSNSSGVATEQGTTIRIDATAKVSSVKDASNVETNTVTCSFGYQVLQYDANGNPDFTKGTWTSTSVTNALIGSWSTVNAKTGSGTIALGTAYAVRYYIKDKYGPAVIKYLIVPQSKVALSIGSDGIGVGKQLEPTGAALQVKGTTELEGNAKIIGSLETTNPNEIIINGVSYQRSGVGVASGGTWTSHMAPGMLYCTKTMPLPYTPPIGWGFLITPSYSSNGFLWGAQHSIGSSTLRLFATLDIANVDCIWQLVKTS